MGHVSIFGDDFETFDGFRVADNVVEVDRSVLLDPIDWLERVCRVNGAGIPREFVYCSCAIGIGLDAVAGSRLGRLTFHHCD